MTIFDSSGVAIYEAPITTTSTIKRELMGDYYIELTFDVADILPISRGCYVVYNGNRFEIASNVHPEDYAGGYRYTLRFEAQQSQMKRCKVFWRKGENLEVSFSNTTSLADFGELIVENMNAFLGGNTWVLGDKPTDSSLKAISFNGDYCWDAVATIAETFNVEWWTEETIGQVRLCFGKLEKGNTVAFKKGDIVTAIPSKKGDNSAYGTRFYVFGSTKNLPSDYSSTAEGGITNHIVEKRLHLPNGQMYIDAWDNLAQDEIVEQVVFFDDVFPTNVETVTSADSVGGEVVNGVENIVYSLYCANTPFTFDNIIEGEQIQANFTSGDLIGMTFDVEIDTTTTEFDKKFLISVPREAYEPESGDTFILIGVQLPNARVEEAENTLLEVGKEYAKKNSSDTDIYDCPTNAVYCHKNDCNYDLGQRVTLIGAQFGAGGRESRVQGYEKLLYDEYQATYTIGDNSSYSRLSSIEKAIQKNEYSDRVGLDANIIRSRSDNTIPSDYNVYSALATDVNFLHKRRGGIVYGETDFRKGISLFAKKLPYDAERNILTLPFNILVEGGIAWNSSLKDFTEEEIFTITSAVQVDWKTIGKNANGELYVIGGTSGGGGGVVGGVTLDEVKNYLSAEKYTTEAWVSSQNYATQSWVTNKGYITGISSSMVTSALGYTPLDSANFTKSKIKSTLGISDWALESAKPSYEFSEITNKPTTLSGYGITDAYTKTETNSAIDNRINALVNGAPSAYDTLKEIADVLAGNVDSIGDILTSLGTKANKATTLAGYGIVDAYTKTQVDSALAKKWTQDDSLIANWNSAYSWGNHALAGYAKHSDVTGEFKKYVTLSTAQTITGIKNFSNGFKVGNVLVSYNASKNAFILPANVIVEGGIAWNSSLDGFDVPTIAQAVKVDGSTIGKMADGTLYVIDGTGGGIDEEQLANYLTNNNYAKKSDIPSLSGYATKSFVTSQGYITAAAIPTKLSQLEDDVVNVSIVKNFLNGFKVGGALVTYNAEKNAFIFPANAIFEGGIAWNSSIDGFKPQTILDAIPVDEATISKANGYLEFVGQTSGGGVADSVAWGNVTGRPTKLSDFTDDVVSGKYLSILGGSVNGSITATKFIGDLDGIANSATYISYREYSGDLNNAPDDRFFWSGFQPSNIPAENYATGVTLHNGALGYSYQLAFVTSGRLYARYKSSAWSEWRELLDSNNYTKYALSLTGDQTITGIKDFSNGFKVGGALVTYNAEKNTFIFPANAIFEGGIAWNTKLEGFEEQTITSAVIVDGTTIVKDAVTGALRLADGVVGGLDESQLGDYLTRNNYAKKSDIPSLSGYATESFVTTRGYITASAIPTKVSAFSNDASYATESFVTSQGYITSAAISKANIKSILGISDWALAATSPLVNHGKITSATDLAALTTGLGYTQSYTPVDGTYNFGQLLNFATYRGLTQIYIADGYSSTGRTIHFRNDWNKTGIADRAWHEILSSHSYTKYAMSLTTDQSVTGIKNFVNGFKVGGNLITYDASLKAFVLNGNLIVKGGIAWEKQNS